jgi:hypothetical protein
MSEESQPKRGDAAWKEEREAISRRNADAHKKALVEKQSRQSEAAASERAEMDREAKQLRDLNTKISKQQGRRAR